jgi:hypothetical protein
LQGYLLLTSTPYRVNIKGQGAQPPFLAVNPGVYCFAVSKYLTKPSLGRVAVLLFYSYRDRASKDVERKCNWHLLTPFRVVSLTAAPLACLHNSIGIPIMSTPFSNIFCRTEKISCKLLLNALLYARQLLALAPDRRPCAGAFFMLFSQIRERTRARIEIFIYIYKFAKLFREKYLTNDDLLLILQIKEKLDFWGCFDGWK